MSRTQLTLAGVLAVQVLLILLIRPPWSAANAPAESRPLLPSLTEVEPSRIEIGTDGESSVTLRRTDDGWTVDQLDGFPADVAKIDSTLETLRGLRVRRPVATSARYHETFEVADEGHKARVRVWGDGDDPAADLIVGSSPNYRALHVRAAGDDAVFEVSGLSTYDLGTDADGWVDHQLTDVTPDDVVGLRLTNQHGTIELERQDDGWRFVQPAEMADRSPDAGEVESLVRSAATLRFAEAEGRLDAESQGFDPPAAELTLRWREPADDGAEAESATTLSSAIKVGGGVPGADDRRYIARDGVGFSGQIWNSSVTALLERSVDELMPEDAPQP